MSDETKTQAGPTVANDKQQTATEQALRNVVAAHKRVIAAVTPGHPDCTLRPKGTPEWAEQQERYSALFSAWHRATDEAAAVLGWDHRDEVAQEAGKEAGAVR